MNATTQKLVSTIDPKMRASLTRKLTSLKKKHNSLSRVPPDITADRMGMAPIPEAAFETDDIDAAASAPAAAPAVAALDTKYPVTIRKTLDQGDCFYSAIYRASKEREDLLNKLSNCLSLDPSDEALFIESFRDRVANRIISNDGPIIYDNTKLRAETNSNTYVSIIENYPEWFREEFGNYGENIGDRDSFIQRLAYHVREPGEWVGEIEVGIITEELKKCGILLEIRSNTETELYKTSQNMVVIHLYNPNEQHYEYFSFEAASTFRKSIKIRKPGIIKRPIEEADDLPRKQIPNQYNLAKEEVPADKTVQEEYNLKNNQTQLDELQPQYDKEYALKADQKRLDELQTHYDNCTKSCSILKKELDELKSIEQKKIIENITLDRSSKLIELLAKRILDPSPNWKEKIDLLINIPTSLTGDYLRGGDYFEALFQLAIAINILPQYKNKFIKFYDITGYKQFVEKPNYLYNKTILNSGGGEQGISDISFEVSESPNFDESHKDSDKYTCGTPPSPPPSSKNGNPFYFVSVKGYKKEKSVKSEYDIPLLDQQLQLFPDKNKHILVCVKNKEQFLQRLSRTRIEFLKKSIDYVIGYNEVIDAFSEYRIGFFNRLGDKTVDTLIRELYPMNISVQKPMLSLYFHQELVVKSVINRIDTIEHKSLDKPHFLCIGVLPRGGKSFIAGGIINSHKEIKQKGTGYNVLFLTSAVNETRDQFKSDLIDKFSDFSDFEFVDVVSEKGDVSLIKGDSSKPNKFYFISRQLSSIKEQGEKEQIGETSIIAEPDILKKLEFKLGALPDFDIIFFDEAHIGITSSTVRKNFQIAFQRFNIPIVLMTATYKKPANILDSLEDLFVWDLSDVKEMKSLSMLSLDQFIEKTPDVLIRYPKVAEEILRERIKNGETEMKLAKPYLNFPNPNFISLTFTDSTIRNLIESGGGYSFTRAFEVNSVPVDLLDYTKYNDWGNMIRNKEHALRLRQFLTPEEEPEDIDFLKGNQRKFRALNQIFRIAQDPKNPSRPIQGKPFSILMFLPFNFGERHDIVKIGELCRIWGSFMRQASYWRNNFVFLTLSTLTDPKYKPHPQMTPELAVERGLCHREDFPNIKDLKKLIRTIELEALKKDKGLVILSGDVAKMGISLPCVDVVCMMTNNADADDLIQKMYRGLTDDPPMKKNGFIIDLDLKRIIRAMFEYDMEKDKLRTSIENVPSVEERLTKVFELCNWGTDAYIEDHPEKDFNDIMNDIKSIVLDQLKNKILGEFDNNLKKLDEEQIKLINEDSDLKNEMKSALEFTSSKKGKKPPKPQDLSERGTAIPEGENPVAETRGVKESAAEERAPAQAASQAPRLNEKEINEKMKAIIKTFVNSLVIKSAEPWTSNLNMATLLKKFNEDKMKLPTPISCECTETTNCKKQHDNLYQAAFCELKNYAMVPKTDNKFDYNYEIHQKIMALIENIFKNSKLVLNWNIYIENLLKEISQTKSLKIGGKYTRKLRRPKVDGVFGIRKKI